jgi:flagellar basal-body rod protein FlgB
MDLSNALKHRMDFLVQRQGIVSGNIANVNTPDYAARDIDFRALTERNLAGNGMITTDQQHMNGAGASGGLTGALNSKSYPVRLDGNAVTIEEEMLKMGSLRGEHALLNSAYSKYTQMYRTAISTGR